MIDKTFVHFFIGFVVIITAAFGILAFAGSKVETDPVDNLALPQ